MHIFYAKNRQHTKNKANTGIKKVGTRKHQSAKTASLIALNSQKLWASGGAEVINA